MEKQPLTIDQLKALAKECGDYELLVLFAGTTGLRWGELAALQCRDISLLNRSVNVSKAYSNGLTGEKILGPTKTHQVRTVPLTKELIPALQELIQSRPADSHLFQMPFDGVLDYNNFMTRIFRPAVKKVGYVGVGFMEKPGFKALVIRWSLPTLKKNPIKLQQKNMSHLWVSPPLQLLSICQIQLQFDGFKSPVPAKVVGI
jgi:integrase